MCILKTKIKASTLVGILGAAFYMLRLRTNHLSRNMQYSIHYVLLVETCSTIYTMSYQSKHVGQYTLCSFSRNMQYSIHYVLLVETCSTVYIVLLVETCSTVYITFHQSKHGQYTLCSISRNMQYSIHYVLQSKHVVQYTICPISHAGEKQEHRSYTKFICLSQSFNIPT